MRVLMQWPSHEIPEMIACVEPLNSGFALSDPEDPRHQYITGLRRKFGEFLHKASVSLQQQGEENTVDAVHGLVSVLLPRCAIICSEPCCRSDPFERISWNMGTAEIGTPN